MKSLRIAFVYNVRHQYPDPEDLRSQEETDFDDPATIETMVGHLRACGYEVLPIEADENCYPELMRSRDQIDLVFNYAEGLHGLDRECHLPAMLEMLQIPYTGSGPLTQALVLNKARTKDVLRAHGVPVLSHCVLRSAAEAAGVLLDFPLIVKPLAQGSSAGITNDSVVRTPDELENQVARVLEALGSAVMIEPFVSGREFSVAMLGNPPQVLPPIEPNHKRLPEGYEKIDSLEVKWILEESAGMEDYLQCPAPLEGELLAQVQRMCLDTWTALGIRDLCRVDIRCDRQNRPYVLEVNSPPGLLPPEISQTSYFPLAARTAGIGYRELLKRIIESAWTRVHP
jgi:D-alanine-D-alanine ligase